jgi:hypothetical protein
MATIITIDSFYVPGENDKIGTGWTVRHNQALSGPFANPHERAIVGLLRGWLDYRNACIYAYEAGPGSDGVLGEPWADIGVSIIKLLNGETGRLDCGTIDGAVRRILKAEGFERQAEEA